MDLESPNVYLEVSQIWLAFGHLTRVNLYLSEVPRWYTKDIIA